MASGWPSWTWIVMIIATCTTALSCHTSPAEELQVAVASNFAEAMTKIAMQFQEETGRKVSLSFGSTGKHYAQIRNGAPFDLFFAADVRRPALLEEQGAAAPGSRFTYAIGKLALWSPDPGYVDTAGDILTKGSFRFLAIANPELAPYGKAARQVLEAKGIWDRLSRRMVQGENISQSFEFVRSGSADLGFVAYSQVMRGGKPIEGSIWAVPDSLYAPIVQQAVVIKESNAARAFVAFVRSEEGRQIIHDSGYETP